MFQHTSEVIINSNEGRLSGIPAIEGKRFAAVALDATNGLKTTSPTHLLIDGANLFEGAHITAAYINKYAAPVNEVAAITVPAASAAGKVLRLRIAASEEGLVSPTYVDAQLKHKKPFFYEISGSTTAADNATAFAKAINDEMALTDFPFFKASVSSTTLTLTADNCYTRFAEISIVEVNEGANVNATGWEDYVSKLSWIRKDGSANGVALTKGSEGAGTVARLIKNLRVPTDANTDPFAADNGGRPVPGGHYDQYTIEYTTDRRHIGGQVMGALDKSITTHVFFLKNDGTVANGAIATAVGASAEFNTALSSVLPGGVTLKDAKGVGVSIISGSAAGDGKGTKNPELGSKL